MLLLLLLPREEFKEKKKRLREKQLVAFFLTLYVGVFWCIAGVIEEWNFCTKLQSKQKLKTKKKVFFCILKIYLTIGLWDGCLNKMKKKKSSGLAAH